MVDVVSNGTTTYEPPHRLVVSWDISPTWQIETEPDKTSELEVRFIAAALGQTRVELEHRNLDRHGQGREGAGDGVGRRPRLAALPPRYAELFGAKR